MLKALIIKCKNNYQTIDKTKNKTLINNSKDNKNKIIRKTTTSLLQIRMEKLDKLAEKYNIVNINSEVESEAESECSINNIKLLHYLKNNLNNLSVCEHINISDNISIDDNCKEKNIFNNKEDQINTLNTKNTDNANINQSLLEDKQKNNEVNKC